MSDIKDVAKLAGVSISTVSNVLNDSKYVSPELRKRVQSAVKELGYVADPIARTMKSKTTMTIGVITADMCGLFYPYLIKGIYQIADEKGYHIIISDSGTKGQSATISREKANFRSLVHNRVDGIIFVSAVPQRRAENYLKRIKNFANSYKYTPLVSIERDFSMFGIDSVCFDSFTGAEMATKHLIDCGCKRIGHISGPSFIDISIDRINGYKKALKKAGLEIDEKTMIANGEYSHQSGYKAMTELLGKMEDIDGVFVANDQMAVGALKALSKKDIRVPEDIKVIGYDNVFVSSILEPPLSTIHIRKKPAGIEAAKLLFEKIERGEEFQEARKVAMESRLVVRKSTVVDAPEDWILSEW